MAKKTNLKFIHIIKTAGTSIEDIALENHFELFDFEVNLEEVKQKWYYFLPKSGFN